MTIPLKSLLEDLLLQEQLPASFFTLVEQHYLPLARQLMRRHRPGQTLVVGINGAQGSGKTTLCRVLEILLPALDELRCVTLSIDDLYLGREARHALARQVHPLLQTRGVPGTHDVALGQRVLHHLQHAHESDSIALPRFDKSTDNPRPRHEWPRYHGRADIVLFEGWCVAAVAEAEESATAALNTLEREEDPDGSWRRHVNQQLRQDYAELFRPIDFLVMLKTPSMAAVRQWRGLQEQKLRAAAPATGMNDEQLQRFIQHYERLTVHTLAEMPARADVVLELDPEHNIRARKE